MSETEFSGAGTPAGTYAAGGCAMCGYSLEGLPLDALCPECGTPTEFSRRGNELEFSSPEYVGKLASGLRWVTVGILVAIVLSIAAGIVASAAPNLVSLVAIVNVLVSLAILWGWWRFSEPDPRYEGRFDGSQARRVLRVTLVASVALSAVNLVLEFVPQLTASLGLFAALVVMVIGMVAWVIQFFASMNYLMWVLARVPDYKERKNAARFRWLGPLIYILGAIVIIGPLIALVLYWNMLDRTRKKIKGIRARMDGAAPVTAG